ncbi:MAG: EboA domain-containing protein [Hyphomicrobium sp.]|nr:EboA domain-containing protein [Hyphomicrobium sp.]
MSLELMLEKRCSNLRRLLDRRLSGEAMQWLTSGLQHNRSDFSLSTCAAMIAIAPRRVGRNPLVLSNAEVHEARAVRPGIDLSAWTTDQTARTLIVLDAAGHAPDRFQSLIDAVFRTGEIGEQVALLQALPLFPYPSDVLPHATEGIRSAVQPIFEAVAHRNPYPYETFNQQQCNQMVLKALFIGSRLAPIVGLDARANPDLARTLIDYAHERWAAHREVAFELWRCVGPFLRIADLEDIGRVLNSPEQKDCRAAALALTASSLPQAQTLLRTKPNIADAITAGRVAWDQLS